MEIENLDIKKQFYKTLNERQRRLYTGQLAVDLGHGSIKAICASFDIDPKTVWAGIRELKNQEELPQDRIRKEGGGRKKT